MEDFYISQKKSDNYSNIISHYHDYNDTGYNNTNATGYYYYADELDISEIVTCVIISISLPLTLVAIYALYSQLQKDHVAPIYIINLFISDLIQLCCMIVKVTQPYDSVIQEVFFYIYYFGLMASVGFMVCVALERYLVITWPLWYHFRRTIKTSLVVSVVVWTLPLVYVLPFLFVDAFKVSDTIFAFFLLVPFPLLIFFLVGTLKALSASRVPADEKRRIVGILVLVLVIYTLLFLPSIIWFLVDEAKYDITFSELSFTLLQFSPLADLTLYVFIRKGAVDKLLASVCRCRMDIDDNSRSSA